jgi:hypothetical protein
MEPESRPLSESDETGWVTISEEFIIAFEKAFNAFVATGKCILRVEFSPPMAGMVAYLVESQKAQGVPVNFYCVVLFHSDEETPRIYPPKISTPEQTLQEKRTIKDFFAQFPLFHFVEIPFGFVLNEEYLWGLFDTVFPHSVFARRRRVWEGRARRRVERALHREGAVPLWRKKEGANNEK